MIIVFTGNGKGKTSAALGTALRALGWGRRVAIIQFIKGNKEVGEWQFIQEIKKTKNQENNIDIYQFFDDKKLSITEKSILENKEYIKSCEDAWEFAKETILDKDYDLVILDEICNALHYKLIDEKNILDFIRKNSSQICGDSDIDIVITGRNASQKLIDIADLITEMNEVKHPFQKGIAAKEGIDF